VDARVRYTDRHVHLETVRPGGVSLAHIARWKEVVTARAGLVAFRRVRAWARAADAQPPVVLAGIDPTPPKEDTPAESIRSFLERMLPFVFRHNAQPEQEATSPAAESKEPATPGGNESRMVG
jgi:hypothetical protein